MIRDIILSIKPEFANKIVIGEKKYEYRKRLCRQPISKIYIYVTSPVKKVIAEVAVEGKLIDDKEELWKKTKSFAGIDKKYYDIYFMNQRQAGAYRLGKVFVYPIAKDLKSFGVVSAPQSFIYSPLNEEK